MRVLMLNDYGRPLGGAELQMLALRDGLRARGHQVRLMSTDAGAESGLDNQADRVCRGAAGSTHVLNPAAWRALRRELDEHPPDVVHIRMFLWQISPAVLPLLAGVPVLFQAAIYKAVCPNGLKLLPDGRNCEVRAGTVCLTSGCVPLPLWSASMLQLRLLRRWRRHIDQTAVLSERMAEIFRRNGWDDVMVLPNGVDAVPARPPLGPDPVVAYAGRLTREKGVEVLLEAFLRSARSFPRAQLLIAGTGPIEAELQARAAPLGDAVRFLGHLPREEMERRFAAAWVQVVPSLWHEPFGNVTPEAMMRGTAVVASDVGGQSDIVRDGRTGFLVPPGEAQALADRLAALLGDRERAERLGRCGREVALAEYSRGAALDRIEAAYGRAIARHRAAQGA